ncbi:MAG: sigma 54-interacting transcriptional regulator [Bdellovibrionales bacterium]|nr:sigma 54-interacting transcriptional regulator [Bdellovibrionales bacterium]
MSALKPMLGDSPQIRAVQEMIDRVAPNLTNVLIIGESGTGKELVARAIHARGPRATGPFVAINCGAIPENLIESELFGHRRGSFTGAVSDKKGLFEIAKGGTIFLDEIGELPLSMQVKLLRALQDRAIRPVGGNETIAVDGRVIAATNRDLEKAAAEGRFREDLYYRLNVILIKTPPLREREGDMERIAMAFVQKFAAPAGGKVTGISEDALTLMRAYPWPGNIRELENAMERAVMLEPTERITVDVLPPAVQRGSTPAPQSASRVGSGAVDFTRGPVSLENALATVEREHILAALKASRELNRDPAALLSLSPKDFKARAARLGIKT